MTSTEKPLILMLRSFALISVVTLGLLSILAIGCGGSSGDDPAPSFADAGPDQSVNINFSTWLDGSGSNAPDGNSFDYTWSLASAPGPWGYEDPDGDGYGEWLDWPALSDGIAIVPTFTPDQNGEYRLLLTVNDGEQSSEMDEVIITASGGACLDPLNLVTALPFLPGMG